MGFVLTTGINSAYVLGYSGAVMVPLGWVGGVVGLIAATAISLYANVLIAELHEFGGKRHIRYRDLAGFIYGMSKKLKLDPNYIYHSHLFVSSVFLINFLLFFLWNCRSKSLFSYLVIAICEFIYD